MMKEKLILFGAGYQGKAAYNSFKENKTIVCFADNNFDLCGELLFGKQIISVGKIHEYYDSETDIIICSSLYYCEMGRQLFNLGIEKYFVYYDGEIYLVDFKRKDAPVKICSRCVMNDSSDEYIIFKESGECNYCTNALRRMEKEYFPNDEGQRRLKDLLNRVKKEGQGKKYDCVMGISGGLDSSYLLYLGYKWGLRILAIHIDDGFDTEISQYNLDKLIKNTGFDYEVIKPDAEQFNDLALAYMKAGVPNIAVPQDNVLFASIYSRMKEYGIKYFLSGGNFSLESILQKGNTHNAFDLVNLLDIHEKFGTKGIDKLKFISQEEMDINKNEHGIESPRPLNYIEYNRDRAFKELNVFCGFKYYGRKHLENIYTAFAQLYWFPQKFGVDKRTSHLSSMIVSGQTTREEAIKELQSPLYDEQQMQEYIEIICDRFGITKVEFDAIMNSPSHNHKEYKTEAM